MRQQTTRISPEDISRQLQYCREVAALSAARPAQPLAFVDTYAATAWPSWRLSGC